MTNNKGNLEIFEIPKDNNYRSIYSAGAVDRRLALDESGLLWWMLTRPPEWDLTTPGLLKCRPKDGRDKIYRMITNLIAHGYIERFEIREHGRFQGYRYRVHERPLWGDPFGRSPYTDKPDTVQPDTENPLQVNIDQEVVKKNTSRKQPSGPHAAMMAVYQQCLGYPIPDAPASGRAAKQMIQQGYTAEQVRACYLHLKRQQFWAGRLVSLVIIAREIGEFVNAAATADRRAGAAERAAPLASRLGEFADDDLLGG